MPLLDLTGQRFGLLTAIERAPDGPHPAQTRWWVMCDCGTRKAVDRSKLRDGSVGSCGGGHHHTGEDAPNWRGSRVSYSAAHYRTRKAKGSATDHTCAECGGRAREWAYRGGAADEKWEEIDGYWHPYSLEPDDYQPMCKKCHTAFDRKNPKGAPSARGGRAPSEQIA